MSINLVDLCDAVATTLRDVSAIRRVQSYNELTEDYPDLPLAIVYPESGETDVTSSNTERQTFQAGSRVSEFLVHVDIPCRQRSQIDQDMAAMVVVTDAVESKLKEQFVKPYFGNNGIKGFHWRWERVNFVRGQAEITYPGVRFFIWVRTF